MSTTIKNGQPAGGDPVVTSTSKSKNKRSTFKLDYSNASTPMFGLCTPFWNEYGVPADKWKVRSSHDLRSMNLSAPLMQNLIRHKFYTATPMRAILPRTWDFIYNNPVQGKDINSAHALPLLDFNALVSQCFNILASLRATGNSGLNPALKYGDALTRLLVVYTLLDGVYGPKAVCKMFSIIDASSVGYISDVNAGEETNQVSVKQVQDYIFEVIAYLLDMILSVSPSAESGLLAYSSATEFEVVDTARLLPSSVFTDSAVSYIGTTQGVWSFIHWWQSHPCVLSLGQSDTMISAMDSYSSSEFPSSTYLPIPRYGDSMPSTRALDISPLIAYQMSMAEFMTDSKIDAIYSADMWRNQFDSLGRSLSGQPSNTFVLNGVTYEYDAFSAVRLGKFVSALSSLATAASQHRYTNLDAIFAFMDLFTLKANIRYKDYFSGARKQPLAVGDVTAEVKSDAVSAVDITKSIQWQRFLNQVNRIGPKTKNYLQGIYGESPMPRADVPSYLCDVSESVGTQEVENTADAQIHSSQSTTAVFRSKGGKYMFEFSVKEECILLGISYFTLRQFYARYMSWQALNRKSRDDMFNPYFQHIGDQPISSFELGYSRFTPYTDETPTGDLPIFGYTSRDMQYKTRVDICSGAFAPNQSLSAWLFTFNPNTWVYALDAPMHIDSDFIRYSPEELCHYYNVVPRTTTSAESFDFVVVDHNFVSCSRNMSYNPQIL